MPEKPITPPVDPERSTGFLSRWSERKANAATERDPLDIDAPAENIAADAADPAEVGDPAAAEDAPPPVTEADLENLTYESDYTKFMGEHVPEAIRRRALRQLWRSDPILANVDGLCDYDDDFTDAALAVKVLKTAHKVGQGYLTDEEVAANQAKGTPPPAAEDAENADDIVDDKGEDMEDFDADADEADVAADDATADAVEDEPVVASDAPATGPKQGAKSPT